MEETVAFDLHAAPLPCKIKGASDSALHLFPAGNCISNGRSADVQLVCSACTTVSSRSGGLVVCFGEMLIDFVPTVCGVPLADAPTFKKAAGGAPANVAVCIARLGGYSAFMGKVGDDDFGHMLVNLLHENGVDNSGVVFDAPSGARTGLAFVKLRADGERDFMFFRHPSADMMLQESEIDKALIRRAAVFHYGSISMIAEPCRSAHLAAIRVAQAAGVLLSYDPNLRLPLWESATAALEGIMSIWKSADIVKVSVEEVTFLTYEQNQNVSTEGSCGGDHVDEGVQKLMHPGLKLLLVTEGKDGCRYYTQSFKGKVKGLKVTSVDTTGAGDAFMGGMLWQVAKEGASLLQDEGKVRSALLFANACGAITTTERGAIPALVSKEAVRRLLARLHQFRASSR